MRLAELFERDAALCWICRDAVEYHLPRLDPRAPSIDHVIPRDLGGSDDPRNLRLAHRRCNSLRGARLPELDWPRSLALSAPAELWSVLVRATARPGTAEIIAAGDPGTLGEARSWLEAALKLLFPGLGFELELRAQAPATLLLRAHPAPAITPPPLPNRRRRSRR